MSAPLSRHSLHFAGSLAGSALMPPIKRREKHFVKFLRGKGWGGEGACEWGWPVLESCQPHTYQHTIRCWLPHKIPLLTNSPAPPLPPLTHPRRPKTLWLHLTLSSLSPTAVLIASTQRKLFLKTNTTHTHAGKHNPAHTRKLARNKHVCSLLYKYKFIWVDFCALRSPTLPHSLCLPCTHTPIVLVPFRSAFYARRCWRRRLCRPVTIVLHPRCCVLRVANCRSYCQLQKLFCANGDYREGVCVWVPYSSPYYSGACDAIRNYF